MKKTFSIIATAFAFLLAFTSCEKDEDVVINLLDGDHTVETEIHAEISGGFTKAFAFKVGYTDFEGKTDTVMVNPNFDGKNATFDKKFQVKVSDDDVKASVRIKAILGEVDNYKSEFSPYAAKYHVIVKLDGKEFTRYDRDEVVETESGISIYDDSKKEYVEDWGDDSIIIDEAKRAYNNYFESMFGNNGDKDYVISVGRKGIDFNIE